MLFNEVLMKEAYVLLQAAKFITNEFDPVIDLMIASVKNDKYIVCLGLGKNEIIAMKFATTNNSFGISSICLDSTNAQHGDLGATKSGQLVVCFSKSANTEELIITAEACCKKGCKLVAITCNAEENKLSRLTLQYDGIHIPLPCEFECDALSLAPTASSTLFVAIADALACVVADKLGLTREQFYQNHPSGSLGKQLKEELNK
jgi:arabinose-5-phosphate isomerase